MLKIFRSKRKRENALLRDLGLLAELLEQDGLHGFASQVRDYQNDLGFCIQEKAPRVEKAKITARLRQIIGGRGVQDMAVSNTTRALCERVYIESYVYQE